MSNITYSVVRVDLEGLGHDLKVHVNGSLCRFCCLHSGRIFSSPDNSFFFTDLDGQYVAALCHIVEVNGGFASVRLVSERFFDKLFEGSAGEVA